MQKWYVNLALACGCSVAVAGAVSAQAIEVKALPAQAQPMPIQVQAGQAQAIQIQVQAGQAQALPVQVQILPAQGGQVQIQPVQVMPGKARPFPGPGFNPGGSRLTPTDAIFVGRVVAFEPMDVEAPQTAGGAKATYRVAIVEVSDAVFGLKKDTKQVRVAFIVQGNNNPGIGGALPPGVQVFPVQPQPGIALPPNGLRRPFPGNIAAIQLQMGQEGLFSVNKHHKETFYLSPTYQQFVDRQNNAGFDGEVKTAKQLSKVMADPVKGLKSEDKQDRYTAAAILIAKYRMPVNTTGQPMKSEPIDAEESKLILKAMAEGDWTPNNFNGAIPAPYTLFGQLGINQNDGYNPVNLRTAQEIYQAMQKWIDENQGKYRISRMVVDANAQVPVAPPGNPGFVPGGPARPPIRIQPQPVPVPLPAPAVVPPPANDNK